MRINLLFCKRIAFSSDCAGVRCGGAGDGAWVGTSGNGSHPGDTGTGCTGIVFTGSMVMHGTGRLSVCPVSCVSRLPPVSFYRYGTRYFPRIDRDDLPLRRTM
jgi:hypothetical protein